MLKSLAGDRVDADAGHRRADEPLFRRSGFVGESDADVRERAIQLSTASCRARIELTFQLASFTTTFSEPVLVASR
jgi:hypothetical protein